MSKRAYKTYSKEFKVEAIRLAASQEENEFLKKRRCSLRRTNHEICSDPPVS